VLALGYSQVVKAVENALNELAAWVDGLIQKWLGDGTIPGLIKQFDL
jgi:hypothetical protein